MCAINALLLRTKNGGPNIRTLANRGSRFKSGYLCKIRQHFDLSSVDIEHLRFRRELDLLRWSSRALNAVFRVRLMRFGGRRAVSQLHTWSQT